MSDENINTHDQLLFNMLKECKTLPNFLDHIFGFLHRRTDFYSIAEDSNSSVGLPEGLAEKLVKHAYFKWENDNNVVLQEDDIPPVLLEEEVVSNDGLVDNIDNLNIAELNEEPLEKHICNKDNTLNFSNAESYNGSIFDNYCWSQNISDVDITMKLPQNCISKDLTVRILTNKISVKLKEDVILEGDLCQKCKNSEAIWSVDKQKLSIHLDKCKEMWWDCLVTAENRLDLSKLDCSRHFEDLSEDAQVKIEELGWNLERKRLGLPTSDQLYQQEILKKAWNAEGSPFSGPFDPDQVVFQ